MYGPGGASIAAFVAVILLVIYVKQVLDKSTGEQASILNCIYCIFYMIVKDVETERAPLLRTESMNSCNNCLQDKSKCLCDFPINLSTSSS